MIPTFLLFLKTGEGGTTELLLDLLRQKKKLDIKYLSLPLPVRQTPLQNNVQFFLL